MDETWFHTRDGVPPPGFDIRKDYKPGRAIFLTTSPDMLKHYGGSNWFTGKVNYRNPATPDDLDRIAEHVKRTTGIDPWDIVLRKYGNDKVSAPGDAARIPEVQQALEAEGFDSVKYMEPALRPGPDGKYNDYPSMVVWKPDMLEPHGPDKLARRPRRYSAPGEGDDIKVRMSDTLGVQAAAKKLFNKHFHEIADHIYGAAGAIPGSTVTIQATRDGHLYVFTSHPHMSTSRVFRKGKDGKLEMEAASQTARGPLLGKGYERFHKVLGHLRTLGVHRIMTDAMGSKGGDGNGYYTWPRFGFNGEIERFQMSALPVHIQRAMGHDNDFHTLFSIPGADDEPGVPDHELSGAGAWKRFGSFAPDLEFQVHPNSPHSQLFEDYHATRTAKAGRLSERRTTTTGGPHGPVHQASRRTTGVPAGGKAMATAKASDTRPAPAGTPIRGYARGVKRFSRFTLGEAKPWRSTWGGNGFEHDYFDEAGNKAGVIRVQERNDGDMLHIHWAGPTDASGGDAKYANQSGVEAVRSLHQHLADAYPKAKFLSGIRAGGPKKGQRVVVALRKSRPDVVKRYSLPEAMYPGRRPQPGAGVPYTHADFHQKIHENPGEATNWLAYADWLEEQGKPMLAGAIRDHVQWAAEVLNDPAAYLGVSDVPMPPGRFTGWHPGEAQVGQYRSNVKNHDFLSYDLRSAADPTRLILIHAKEHPRDNGETWAAAVAEGHHKTRSPATRVDYSGPDPDTIDHNKTKLRRKALPRRFAKVDGDVPAHHLVAGFPIEHMLRQIANDPNNHGPVRDAAHIALTGRNRMTGQVNDHSVSSALWQLHDLIRDHGYGPGGTTHPAEKRYNWMAAGDKVFLDAHTHTALHEEGEHMRREHGEPARRQLQWAYRPEGQAIRVTRDIGSESKNRTTRSSQALDRVRRRVSQLSGEKDLTKIDESIKRHAARANMVWRREHGVDVKDDIAKSTGDETHDTDQYNANHEVTRYRRAFSEYLTRYASRKLHPYTNSWYRTFRGLPHESLAKMIQPGQSVGRFPGARGKKEAGGGYTKGLSLHRDEAGDITIHHEGVPILKAHPDDTYTVMTDGKHEALARKGPNDGYAQARYGPVTGGPFTGSQKNYNNKGRATVTQIVIGGVTGHKVLRDRKGNFSVNGQPLTPGMKLDFKNKLEAIEPDSRPNEVLPEDYYGMARTGTPVKYKSAARGDFIQALRLIKSSNQKSLHAIAKAAAAKLGIGPGGIEVMDGLHDTPRGSVPGVVQAVYADVPPEKLHEAAVWPTLTGNLPGTAIFHLRGGGMDTLHQFRQEGSGRDIRTKLDRDGLTDRVLIPVPGRSSFDILIPDRGSKLGRQAAQYAQTHGLVKRSSRGFFKTIGSQDQGKARDRMRKTVVKSEQGTGV